MADVHYPLTADVAAGSWVSSLGGTLTAAIDESSYDDADYIVSLENATGDVAESALATVTPPTSATYTVRYRIRAPGAEASLSCCGRARRRLRRGHMLPRRLPTRRLSRR